MTVNHTPRTNMMSFKRAGFKPKSLLGLSISLLMWNPQVWADAAAQLPQLNEALLPQLNEALLPQLNEALLPQLNEESTPKVGFDTQVEGNTLTVNQSADKVILNWDSFNIGENNAVHFQQVTNGIALNRILDQAPSSILGSLTATGSIYLLNPNGVLFGQHSQVHVGNLLVATQEVDSERFLKSNINTAINDGEAALKAPGQLQGSIDIEKGAHISTESGGSVLVFAPSITNAGTIRTPDGQTVLAASHDTVYLTSSDQDPDLRGVFVEVGTGGDVTNLGEIVAERGNVTLLGLAVNQDGRVRATSSVEVNGTIRLLARDGAHVELGKANSLAEAEKQLAYGIDAASEGSQTARAVLSTRTGELTLGADHASLTQVSLEQPPQAVLVDEATLGAAAFAQVLALSGSKAVDIKDAAGQSFKGVAVMPQAFAQWSEGNNELPRRLRVLSAEGYIDLLAADRILGAAAVDASTQLPGKVELYGKHIEIGENAQVKTPGGNIRILATDGAAPMTKTGAANTDASVHVAAGALLDVSGSEVNLAMERNSLEVEVRGNELRDQPLQRDGVLRGKTVRVDARLGTSMVDTQGSLEKQAKGIAERTSAGGRIEVKSEGEVDFDPNSQVNIQGGKLHYAGGELVTTGLVKDGKVVDISAADPNQVYQGLKTLSRNEAAYTDVQDAGTLDIQARNVQLDALIKAGQTPGERQLKLQDLPSQGVLSINLNHFQNTLGQSVWLSPLRPDDIDVKRETWLNPALISAAGLSQLDLFLRGNLTQERGGDITLAAGGKFTAYGQAVLLAGKIDAAGGTIDISSRVAVAHDDFDTIALTQTDTANHSLHLAQGAVLDTSGNWVNRSALAGQPGQGAVSVLDGGKINLRSRGDLLLDKGATLAANAGAQLGADNALSGGKGGQIALEAKFPGERVAVVLDAALSAQGFSQNGSLSLSVPELQLGQGLHRDKPAGQKAADGSTESAKLADTATPIQKLKAATLLDYDFFAPGGFSRYSITTNLGGADILPQVGERFAWQQRNWVMRNDSLAAASSGRTVAPWVDTQLLPDYLRKPVSLSITQQKVSTTLGTAIASEGYIHLADGVNWQFDPTASVSLSSLGKMYVGGALVAPGGEIALSLNPNAPLAFDPTATLWLGDEAWLSVAGVSFDLPSEQNLKFGKLVDAGRIQMKLSDGRLVTEEGSLIDLSAASTEMDVLTASGYERQTRASNAGTLELSLADGMVWQSHLATQSYRKLGAKGASVSVTLGAEGAQGRVPSNKDQAPKQSPGLFPDMPRGIDLYAQRQQNLLEGLSFGDALPNSFMQVDGNGQALYGRTILFAEDINRWNLDVLSLDTLSSELRASGEKTRTAAADIALKEDFVLDVKGQLKLDTQELRVTDDAVVSVYAPWLKLGETSASTPEHVPADALNPDESLLPTQGRGFLTLRGDEIELAGKLRISGTEESALISQGSLLAHGVVVNNVNRESQVTLTSNGNLSLVSSVFYPGSLSHVVVESTAPEGVIHVASNGKPAPDVLTAGGHISVKAPNIEISGAVSAPLGSLALEGKNVHLAPSARLNVSGNGLLIPLGEITGNDLGWLYRLDATDNDTTYLLKNSPGKKVEIKADRIVMDEGSQIDLSGGGDVLAHQFAPGPTGSKDVLATTSLTEGFALLPYNTAAFDSALQSSGLPRGSRITLSDNALLPAGDYYLLPSRYAMLPGAYWVKPTGKLNSPGQSQTQPDGGVTLTGKLGLGHTGITDADWRGFTFYKSQYDGKAADAMAPNGMASYHLRQSDSFFSKREDSAAMPHALDAGSLVLEAQKALRLSSGITGKVAAGELGARVDILGEDIHLVAKLPDESNASSAGLSLLAEDLSKLHVGSTLVGGSRDDAKPGDIKVNARKVTVEENAKITMPQVILAAKDEVRVKTGAELTATAAPKGTAAGTAAETITLDTPAALLRLGGDQARLSQTDSQTGRITLDKGATLKGQALLVSAGQTQLNSTLALNAGGALSLVGEKIQLGGAAPSEAGNWLYFGDGFFSGLGMSDLSLQARQQIQIADGYNLSATNLSLAAQSITRSAVAPVATAPSAPGSTEANVKAIPAPVRLKADTLSLQGSLTEARTTDEQNISGASLNLEARQIFLGAQTTSSEAYQLAIQGFEQVNVVGKNAVDGRGKTTLTLDGNLDITGSLGTQAQGQLAIHTAGLLATHTGAASTGAPRSDLGGKLDLTAERMHLGGQLRVASGQVSLTSEGDLLLLNGASLDVAGTSRTYGARTLTTPGGALSLTSLKGTIKQDASAQILFGGAGNSDGAGDLALTAAQGQLILKGSINAGTAGTQGGSIRLDAKNLGDLTELSALLNRTFSSPAGTEQTANAQNQIELRLREGDLTLGANAQLQAGQLSLTADQGAIDIQGKLLTPQAVGQVALWANGGLNLGTTAQVTAQTLSLSSQTGAITTAASTQLNLGSKAKPGELNLTAGKEGLVNSRILANTQNLVLNAELRLRQNMAEADGVTIELLNGLNAEAEAFLRETPDLFANLTPGQTTQGGLALHAELYSEGDIRVSNALDLSSWRLGSSQLNNPGRAGSLSLRAGGNVYLDASISDGFTADTSQWGAQFTDAQGLPLEALMSGDSSHINLVSGADLSSSNHLSTALRNGTQGSLYLADGAMLRTGTGDINLASQGNLVMADTGTARIYTAGNTGMRTYAGSEEALPDYGSLHPDSVGDTGLFINKVYYPEGGGDIRINTGGDIQGSKSHQLVNEWLHRAAGVFELKQDSATGEAGTVTRNITTWGIGFQDFSQGIASLGGGSLSINSGGSINNLSVSSANTGKAVGEGLNNKVQQSQSGAVNIQAAGDINSARLYTANNRLNVTSLGQMGHTEGELATILALGDAPVQLTATGTLQVESVFNPTQIASAYQQFGSNPEAALEAATRDYAQVQNYFSTYGRQSAVAFTSLAGDVQVINSQALVNQSYLSKTPAAGKDWPLLPGLNLLPSRLDITSYQGDVILNSGLLLAPEVHGRFNLVAGGNLLADSIGSNSVEVHQLDIAPEHFGTLDQPLYENPDSPLLTALDELWNNSSSGLVWIQNSQGHAANSLFKADPINNWVYTGLGDVGKTQGSEGRFIFASAKGLDISAGRDLSNTSLIIHHQDASQHSSITTGRDLVFTETRASESDNRLKNDQNNGILILGPGSLRVQAGRNISFGTTEGIQSLGQGEIDPNKLTKYNPYLPDKAADLFISAGVNQTPNYAGVIKQYLGVTAGQNGTFIDLLNEA
ncbi:MAG: hypothetical protein RL497_682, partial [Pseudomonadota bacterium]